MTYTRKAEWVRGVAARIATRHPGVTLRLYERRPGDDPGFADTFRAPGLHVEWPPFGPYRDYLASFDDVAIGVGAPVPGKSVLAREVLWQDASLSRCPGACDRQRCGRTWGLFSAKTGVVSNASDVWVDAACRLLSDGEARQRQADAYSVPRGRNRVNI